MNIKTALFIYGLTCGLITGAVVHTFVDMPLREQAVQS